MASRPVVSGTPLDTVVRTPRRRPSATTVTVVLLTLLAAGLRLYRLRFGYAHGVVSSDEGVYFGSSLALTEGTLPYRDYVLVHPPVITLLFTPFAALSPAIGTAQAMALAKIATALAGAASVPLVARLVRSCGLPAVVIAGAVVALHDDAIASAYAPLLEPWVVLFCLLGAVLAFREGAPASPRLTLWAGVLFGVACATKIWAFAPVLALVLVLRADRRRLARLLAGVAAGFAVPVLPFAVLAPGQFVHDVFTVQIFRTPGVRTTAEFRLLHLFSAAPPDGTLPATARSWLVAGAVAVALGLVVVSARTLRRSSAVHRFAVIAGVLVVAMLFVPGTFYWHYSSFAIPFLAIAAVVPLARLRRPSARVWGAVLALCVLGLSIVAVHRVHGMRGLHDEHVAFQRLVPAGSCVVTTKPSDTIANDRYLADGDCPRIVDPFGTALAYSDGRPPTSGVPRGARLAALWLDAFRRADVVYVTRDTPTIPADAAVGRYLRTHFRPVEREGLDGTVYLRVSSPRP